MSRERVDRLQPDQAIFVTLDQIRKASQDTARILGEGTKGEVWSRSMTVDTGGPTDLKTGDIVPDDKPWRSLSIFNVGPDTITVEIYTKALKLDKRTRLRKEDEEWQRPVTIRKRITLKLEYKEDRILALRLKANSTSATVDVILAR